jgi:hypothetical protein
VTARTQGARRQSNRQEIPAAKMRNKLPSGRFVQPIRHPWANRRRARNALPLLEMTRAIEPRSR